LTSASVKIIFNKYLQIHEIPTPRMTRQMTIERAVMPDSTRTAIVNSHSAYFCTAVMAYKPMTYCRIIV